jgi:4-carboxymuconolactone decarboxylase
MIDRLPPMDPATMDEAQRKATAALVAGPRKGVIGPFIALMRSPELLDRFARVGEQVRFHSALPEKLNEFAILVTARHVTNQFEWAIHHAPALRLGVAHATLDALARGERPATMDADEAIVHDFAAELVLSHAVSDASYARALERFGERGVVDLAGTIGYFVAICLVMNMAGTPAPKGDVAPLVPIRP